MSFLRSPKKSTTVPTKLFVDVNVVADYTANRPKFFAAAGLLLQRADEGSVELGSAAMSFPLAFYFTDKVKSRAGARKAIDYVLGRVEVVTMDRALIEAAQVNPIGDLEDAVQYECALRFGAEAIITRDLKDFSVGSLQVYSPDAWLKANPLT